MDAALLRPHRFAPVIAEFNYVTLIKDVGQGVAAQTGPTLMLSAHRGMV
jgi:hypothetical protein